jgi:hypothetical protein
MDKWKIGLSYGAPEIQRRNGKKAWRYDRDLDKDRRGTRIFLSITVNADAGTQPQRLVGKLQVT